MAASDRNPWVRVAIISAGLSLFCVALVMIVVQLWNRRPAGDVGDPLCETDDCLHHASILEEVASRDVDLCDDFSAYVCSAWSPARIQTQRIVTAMDFAVYGWMKALNKTLHEGSGKIPVGRKAMLLYDTCMGDDWRYGNSASELLLFLNETGLIWPFAPVPKVDALALFLSLAFSYDASFWFSVAISDSPGSSDEWRVVLSPSFELLTIVVHTSVIESAVFTQTWTKMLQSFAGDAARDLDEAEINETNSVGAEILRQLYAASGDPTPESALFAMAKIEDYTPSISSTRWLNAFQQVLPLTPTMTTEVFVTHVGYLRTIDSLFAKLGNERLLKHLSWLFLKMYISIAGPKFFIGVHGNAETFKVVRPLFCGLNVEQPYRLLVSVLSYVSRAVSNDRPLIDASFDSLVVEATDKLMNCYWLDERSRVLAMEKVKAVQKRLWPEDMVFEPGFLDDMYGDFPENETLNFGSTWIAVRESVRGVKASKLYRSLSANPIGAAEPYLTYDAILNRVLMTMGVVARPLYYRNGTRGMLYGGIGFLMALQLVKSLDRNGLRWHPNGSAVGNFLTEGSMKEYVARDSCLVQDAKASVFPEIPAVEVAYAALQRALKEDGRRFRIAKDLTEERVFFMTLCFMTCPRRYTPSAYKVDCNKALRNFAEFATAYGCPRGSNMNPPKKCKFFDSALPNPGA
ncbi:endothelin-converting enzyme 1-like [Rhipicephalus microplus]|uniref:endothelin-converting enzyme 1-like n=1 Tax=Rhipicephalus microplus TaxID=6941 RepID=UPI003F6C87C7